MEVPPVVVEIRVIQVVYNILEKVTQLFLIFLFIDQIQNCLLAILLFGVLKVLSGCLNRLTCVWCYLNFWFDFHVWALAPQKWKLATSLHVRKDFGRFIC